jgi:hypothetical protein
MRKSPKKASFIQLTSTAVADPLPRDVLFRNREITNSNHRSVLSHICHFATTPKRPTSNLYQASFLKTVASKEMIVSES